MMKLGIIFADNNPLLNLIGSPSLKNFVLLVFCVDDSAVTVFVNDSADAVSILAELSDGLIRLAVGQQYLGMNASNPQICLFFNLLNSSAVTNFASGWQSGKDVHVHTVSSSEGQMYLICSVVPFV